MTHMILSILLPLAVPLAYLIGRYRRTSEIAELRRTLKDRTVDRNHWMHEAEQWQGMYWKEWNANEYEAAERN